MATTTPTTTTLSTTTPSTTPRRRPVPSSTPIRRRRLAAVAPAGLLLAAILGAGACGGSPPAGGGASGTSTQVTAGGHGGAPEPVASTVNARITTTAVVRSEPSPGAKQVTTLEPTTPLGSPTTVLVLDERDGWLHVSLPIRPNGSTGWMRADGADLRTNPLAITVERERHRLVMTRGGRVELDAPIADGTPENPTPAGTFYVTDIVDTAEPAGPYGPWALGLSAHSDTLERFGGGDGQIGLHGTNEPGRIGSSVSHGCVRVTNDVISRLVESVGLGTPVTVV